MFKYLRIVPGVLLVALLTALAYVISTLPFAPFTLASGSHPIEAMAAGLLVGIIIASVIKLPSVFISGIHFSMKTVLSIGIVLLGVKLNLFAIMALPIAVPVTIILTTLGALFSAMLIGRLLGNDPITSLLVGVGNAICGSSAIMATSRVIPLDHKNHVPVAVSTVNVLGLGLVFILPALAHLLHLNDLQMGLWAGATGQAVPQAIAAGFAYSQQAGTYATAIKLTRVLQLGIYVFIFKLIYHRTQGQAHPPKNKLVGILNYIPLFIIFFIIVVLLNSFVHVPTFTLHHYSFDLHSLFGKLSAFLLSMSLTAIGLHTDIKLLIRYGGKNLIIGAFSTLVAVEISLIGATFFVGV